MLSHSCNDILSLNSHFITKIIKNVFMMLIKYM